MFTRTRLSGLGQNPSLSLDLPVSYERKPYFRKPNPQETAWLLDKPAHYEERFYLYLPRNLSFCCLCNEVVKQHAERKIQHLNDKLIELQLSGLTIPAAKTRNKESLPDSAETSESEDGLWLGVKNDGRATSVDVSKQVKPQPIEPASILRKSNNRSKSFPPLRKCSGKKVVRFADSLGLELENVRYMVINDLPPYIPSRAFADLHQIENSLELEADFQNPSSLIDFEFRVGRQSVCLHSVRPTYTTVYGLVRVLNLTFGKNVFVRYSTNGWRTFNDAPAVYAAIDNGNDGGKFDNFSFNIFTSPGDFQGMRELKLIFAVCFKTQDGREFWDNNGGQNYTMSGYYKPITTKAHYKHSWVHFL